MKNIFIYLIILAFSYSSGFAQSIDSTISFHVSGLCGMCEQRIEKAAKIKGVTSTEWSSINQQLTIRYNPSKVSSQQVQQVIALSGHDTETEKAPDDVYNKLPDCCLYREVTNNNDSIADSILQNAIKGLVVEISDGQELPLKGASLQWSGTSNGTTTNSHGEFMLLKSNFTDKLVISYTGYKTDTLSVSDLQDIQITLNSDDILNAVVVTARKRTTYINTYDPFRTSIITKKELLKAACCNLSESFETNPSVDVSYSDAATGSKQIHLLGLSGPYTQLTVENLPGPRGIATPLGLNSIAGPWVESIQLIKGTGSVVNGFESIAGQINVELRKPRESEKLYLNGYLNSMGKTDFNLNWAHKLNDKWATSFLLHDNFMYSKQDMNKDGFLDSPTGNQFSGVHRWDYLGGKGLMVQAGVKWLFDNKTGGEWDFDSHKDKFTTNNYGLGLETDRYEAFGKIGFVFPEKMYKSIGWQLSYFNHDQDAYFGLTNYDASQHNFYSNLIYQSQIGSDVHSFKTGLSITADEYKEKLKDNNYDRTEIVPGGFFEYTFAPNRVWDIVAGIRTDYNNIYGWFTTPRLNIRYEPWRKTTIRLSAGRGQRTANIFAENIGVLVSSRQLFIQGGNPDKAYGLDPEIAWNKGISLDQKFKLFGHEANAGIDFYRNDFSNQVIIDIEEEGVVKFYNLEGKSFSNSLQAEVNFMPANKFDIRLAYRYFDVKATYGGELLDKPFTAKHRAFANLAYDLNGWKLDYTINYIGRKRIPSTSNNPSNHQLPSKSRDFATMNAQISKTLGKKKLFDIYLGGENLSNYVQMMSILGADDPFSSHFDASMIWGPVSGRLIYTGFRYTIK